MPLRRHVEEDNAWGVALCLWPGANPHTPVRSLRFGTLWEDDEDDDRFSAVYQACGGGHVEILRRLGPDPSRDDFDELYGVDWPQVFVL